MLMHLACWMVTLVILATGNSAGSSLNARTFGAAGTGKKDDSAAIQKALDSCAAKGGGTVRLPAGKYRLDKPISVPSGVLLAGEWEAPHHTEITKGTVILAYAGKGKEDAPPLIRLSPNSSIKGLTIFYPEQRVPDVQPYPWTIHGAGTHCSIQDVTLVNPYKAMDFGTEVSSLHYIRNVFGCPLKAGLFVHQCYDIGRVENVHFNPHYWMSSEVTGLPKWDDLADYLLHNCIAFDFGKADWEYVLNTFSWGCKVGYRFIGTEHGACNGNFLGIGADWAQTPILVEQTDPPGLLITNGEFVGCKGSETMIDVSQTNNGVVQLSNCSFWGFSRSIARVAGDGTASFSQCNFAYWNLDNEPFPAIEARGGDLIVQACRFGRDVPQVVLQPGLKTAVIMGNRMAGEIKIENQSQGDIQILGNVSRAKAK